MKAAIWQPWPGRGQQVHTGRVLLKSQTVGLPGKFPAAIIPSLLNLRKQCPGGPGFGFYLYLVCLDLKLINSSSSPPCPANWAQLRTLMSPHRSILALTYSWVQQIDHGKLRSKRPRTTYSFWPYFCPMFNIGPLQSSTDTLIIVSPMFPMIFPSDFSRRGA